MEDNTGGKSSTDQRGFLAKGPNRSWTIILLVYVLLFCATGYVAFLRREINPAALMSKEELELFESYGSKDFLLESYQKESTAFAARQELATQSFNVVLGAVLGFLSASVAGSMFRGRDDND